MTCSCRTAPWRTFLSGLAQVHRLEPVGRTWSRASLPQAQHRTVVPLRHLQGFQTTSKASQEATASAATDSPQKPTSPLTPDTASSEGVTESTSVVKPRKKNRWRDMDEAEVAQLKKTQDQKKQKTKKQGSKKDGSITEKKGVRTIRREDGITISTRATGDTKTFKDGFRKPKRDGWNSYRGDRKENTYRGRRDETSDPATDETATYNRDGFKKPRREYNGGHEGGKPDSRYPVKRDGPPVPVGQAAAPEAEGAQKPKPEDLPLWRIQKEALKEKFPDGWKPRKRLSPDALAGIRALNAQYPDIYGTAALAAKFEVDPEAIRRILKGKWQPTVDEEDRRMKRWQTRGEHIWEAKAALGIKPPKQWRKEGITRDPSWHEWRRKVALREKEWEEEETRQYKEQRAASLQARVAGKVL